MKAEMKQPKLLLSFHERLAAGLTLAALSAATELLIEQLGRKEPLRVFVYIGYGPRMILLNTAAVFSGKVQ